MGRSHLRLVPRTASGPAGRAPENGRAWAEPARRIIAGPRGTAYRVRPGGPGARERSSMGGARPADYRRANVTARSPKAKTMAAARAEAAVASQAVE